MTEIDLKKTLKQIFDVDLPISGGSGQNIDDLIVIEVEKDGVKIEYQIIGFIQQLGGKSWKMEKQELIPKDGRWIDKISIVLDDDLDHYHNFYFDITRFYGK